MALAPEKVVWVEGRTGSNEAKRAVFLYCM